MDNIVFVPGEFLSTLSLRRATERSQGKRGQKRISIHALLAESDGVMVVPITPTYEFLSTLSLRRATLQRQLFEANSCISIHALLAESDLADVRNSPNNQISIHALLAESDHACT